MLKRWTIRERTAKLTFRSFKSPISRKCYIGRRSDEKKATLIPIILIGNTCILIAIIWSIYS